MQLKSHYTDSYGQRRLPECLQFKALVAGTYVLDDEQWYDELDDAEHDDVLRALSALGVETERDQDGLYVTSVPASAS